MLFTVTYLTQQWKINSLLGFRGNNGHAKTPDLFRPVEISCPLLYRFRFSAKWLDFLSTLCGISTPLRIMAYPDGASRSHSLDTPDSVGSLWTSDQPEITTTTWQPTTFARDINGPGGIQTHNLSRWVAADTCFKDSKYPNGLWRYVIHTFYGTPEM
jgi:hypothetical protein